MGRVLGPDSRGDQKPRIPSAMISGDASAAPKLRLPAKTRALLSGDHGEWV